jgi:hypothetical protein
MSHGPHSGERSHSTTDPRLVGVCRRRHVYDCFWCVVSRMTGTRGEGRAEDLISGGDGRDHLLRCASSRWRGIRFVDATRVWSHPARKPGPAGFLRCLRGETPRHQGGRFSHTGASSPRQSAQFRDSDNYRSHLRAARGQRDGEMHHLARSSFQFHHASRSPDGISAHFSAGSCPEKDGPAHANGRSPAAMPRRPVAVADGAPRVEGHPISAADSPTCVACSPASVSWSLTPAGCAPTSVAWSPTSVACSHTSLSCSLTSTECSTTSVACSLTSTACPPPSVACSVTSMARSATSMARSVTSKARSVTSKACSATSKACSPISVASVGIRAGEGAIGVGPYPTVWQQLR